VLDLDPFVDRAEVPATHDVRMVVARHHMDLPSPSIAAGGSVNDDTIASAM
jgi:hypothetical protein